jgi:hypothetical protein
MKPFTKEIELVDKFCEWLNKRDCRYKREIRKGSYHNEGYIDIILRIGKLFIGIEAKLSGISEVIYQASGNQIRCEYSYILYPKKPQKKSLEKIKKYGIGIIIYNSDTNKFEILIRAKRSKYVMYNLLMERNWKENRIGRIFKKNELPDGYPNEKIEALEPTYSWVKTYKEKKEDELKKKHKTLDYF